MVDEAKPRGGERLDGVHPVDAVDREGERGNATAHRSGSEAEDAAIAITRRLRRFDDANALEATARRCVEPHANEVYERIAHHWPHERLERVRHGLGGEQVE